jgi:o-succinylbenzoate---CoA ligase
MRIVAIDAREATWPLDGRGAARGLRERTAILIELRGERGAVGIGEAAPLRGMSRDTLDDVRASIVAFAGRIPGDIDEAAAVTVASPAARFAIETALLTARAAEEGRSLAHVLVPSPAREVPCAAVVDTPEEAAYAGARTLKVKVGRVLDPAKLRAIAQAAPGKRLRIDANRAWPRNAVAQRMGELAGLPIEYVEEPCAGAHELLPLPLPVALDESLAELTDDQIDKVLARDGLAALVLKPTLLGGLRACLRLAERARAAGVGVVVTHALEGPVGTAACAELALAIGGEAEAALAYHEPAAGRTHDEPAAGRATVLMRPAGRATPMPASTRADQAPARPTVPALAVGRPPAPVLAAGLAAHPALAAWPAPVPQLAGAAVRAAVGSGLALAIDLRTPPSGGSVLAFDVVATRRELESATFDIRTSPYARPALPRYLLPVEDFGALSIRTAALAAPAAIAIATADVDVTFARAATAASLSSSATRGRGPITRARVVAATPARETITAVHAALDGGWPIALVHHKLPADEEVRQRELVARATFAPDAAVVLFTSGSTGPARGVVLSRDALLAAADAHARHLPWREDDAWLCALSLAHAGGLAVVVRCLAARRPVVLLDHDFDRAAVAALLERCTLASLVPTQLAALLDDPAWRPPARLRAVLLGGAPATPALLAAAAARGVPFLATYGATETFGQVATADPARAGDPAAPLRALPGVTLSGGTREAPARIRVYAPMLATKYLDDTPIAPQWTTADLGYLDGDDLVVVGRADDVIVSGGEKVHPSQVEQVLAATPGVHAACAFGIPDERWGQIVGAALATDAAFDLAAAAARWAEALPAHARPRRVALVRELPQLPNGKIDRAAARELDQETVLYPRT